MVLKGVDEIDWFTDRPDRVAGEWSPKKLVKKWDVLFSDSAPNAQMSYTWTTFMDFVGAMKGRSNMSFEMFKPSVNKKGTKLSFEVKGIGKKNKERVLAQVGRDVEDISVFIDDATWASNSDSWVEQAVIGIMRSPRSKEYPLNLNHLNLNNANLASADLTGANLTGANLWHANLASADLTSANLTGADLGNTILSTANLTGADRLTRTWVSRTCRQRTSLALRGTTQPARTEP